MTTPTPPLWYWDEVCAPWQGQCETAIRGPVEHVWAARFWLEEYAVDTEIVGVLPITCEVTYDVSWSPYVQGSMTIVRPTDPALLAALDPRKRIRVEVTAGYVLPGAVQDVHRMCVTYLSSREVNYPADTVTLGFQGKEYLYQQWIAGTAEESPAGPLWAMLPDPNPSGLYGWTSGTRAEEAVRLCIQVMTTGTSTGRDQTFGELMRDIGWVDAADRWVGQAGDAPLAMCMEIAGRIDGWFYADENGVWQLRSRGLDGDPSHQVRPGADGTLVSGTDALTREGWANYVAVTYRWQTRTPATGTGTVTDHVASGFATVTDGPYADYLANRVSLLSDRDMPGTVAQAQRAASSLLRRTMDRGTDLNVESVAAYWLRVGSGITLDLPEQVQQYLVISAVTFHLDTGLMNITARLPDLGENVVIALGP
jgi:hypothetical protein